MLLYQYLKLSYHFGGLFLSQAMDLSLVAWCEFDESELFWQACGLLVCARESWKIVVSILVLPPKLLLTPIHVD